MSYGFKPCGHRSGASGVYDDENEPCAICAREKKGTSIWLCVIAAFVIVAFVALVGRL